MLPVLNLRLFIASVVVGGGLFGGGASNGGIVSSETTFNAPRTDGCETLTYAATVNIDFSGKPCKTIALTGNLTLTTSNIAAGRNVVVILSGDATDRTLAVPAWRFDSSQVTVVAASERVTIRLFPTSTTDASTSALVGESPASGAHVFFEGPTGAGVDAGSGNFFSTSGLTCGFGHQRLGTSPTDGCEVHSSKGKLTIATTLNGGTSGDLDIRVGGSANNVNLLDSASNVRAALNLNSNGLFLYGKGGPTSGSPPAVLWVGQGTTGIIEIDTAAKGATDLHTEYRADLYAGAQESWKLYGHGVWTMPTTTSGGIKTATCSAGAITVDLAEPITNVITSGATCVVTVSPTSFGSGGVNEDAEFLFVLGDDPGGAHKVTFTGATSLIPTSCSTTGLTKQGGTARVHYSKVIGKFIFETCQDIL